MRDEPALQSLSDGQVWDLIAYLWKENTSPERLEQAARLYAQNCAACHGEQGAGDGVLAAVAPADGQASSAHSSQDSAPADGHAAVIDGHALQAPADFTDAKTLLGASPALLHGKIVRGGMGTGMPYWGPIFRDDQIWMLVEYLYTFQFDHEMEEK